MTASLSAVVVSNARAGHEPVQLRISGLEHGVTIIEDSDGIPHVFAVSEHDMALAVGWLHARDRLFQIDVSRRQASGTLAELLGESVLPDDVELRTLGLRRAAERSWDALSSQTRNAIQAYAQGVNAYVAEHALPPEYGALELGRFEPWTPVDTVVVGKALAFSLSFGLDFDTTEALLTYQGLAEASCAASAELCFDGTALFFEDLWRSAPFDEAATIPDSGGAAEHVRRGPWRRALYRRLRGVRKALDARTLEQIQSYRSRAERSSVMTEVFRARDNFKGSNEWAVSGRRSRSRRPLLANDPHLRLGNPSTFYPLGIKAASPRFDVVGGSIPGAPYIIQGNNRRLGWGSTVNPLDVTDLFQEAVVPDPTSPSGLRIVHDEPDDALDRIVPIAETYRANVIGDGIIDNLVEVPSGGPIPPATLVVPRRNQGPILDLQTGPGGGVAISLAYTGFSGTRELDAFRKINLARNVDDFVDALQNFDVGSQNFIYADVRGNIAYFTSAEAPLREDLEAGTVDGLPPFFVRRGTGGNDWIPATELTANQAVPFEILPFEEMPQVVNPKNGYVVNANNDPLGLTLDNDPLNQLRPSGGIYYLAPGYAAGNRAGRITQDLRDRLQQGHRVSLHDMSDIQANVRLRDAEILNPFILEAFDRARAPNAAPELTQLLDDERLSEAVGRLRTWQFSTPTGIREGYDRTDILGFRLEPTQSEIDASIATTIYSVWRSQVLKNTIDATLERLGSDVPRPGSSQSLSALRRLLDTFSTNQGVGVSGLDFFAVPGLEEAEDRRDFILLKSLAEALDLLAGPAFETAFGGSSNQDDYRWGRLHRLVLASPLGGPFNLPSATAGFPPPLDDLSGYPADGGFQAVDASSHSARAASAEGFRFSSGPNRRYVARFGRFGIHAEDAYPGGISGVLGEPTYGNLLLRWLTNDSFPWRQRSFSIIRDADRVIIIQP